MYLGPSNFFFTLQFPLYATLELENVFNKALDGYSRLLIKGVGLKVITTPSLSREEDQNENLLGLKYF